jgi:hypothetical protein
MRQIYAAAILVAMSIPAVAQHGQHHSPYAGLQHREIKALDTKQMDDLRPAIIPSTAAKSLRFGQQPVSP